MNSKSIVKKSISLIQIICLVVPLFFMLFVSTPNRVYAKDNEYETAVKAIENSKRQIVIKKLEYPSSRADNIKIWIDDESSAVTKLLGTGTSIESDIGVPFYITPTKNKDEQYYNDVYFFKTYGSSIENFYYRYVGTEAIRFPLEPLIARSGSEDIGYGYTVITTNASSGEEYGRMNFVFNTNKIIISSGNAYKENGKIYARPGSEFNVTTEWASSYKNVVGRNTGWFETNNNGVASISNTNDAKVKKITVGNSVGSSATLTWRNKFGAECNATVIASNGVKASNGLTDVTALDENTVVRRLSANYKTVKTISGRNCKIQIKFGQAFNYAPYCNDLQISGNVSNLKLSPSSNNAYYIVTFTAPKNNTTLNVSYTDWSGAYRSENWDLIILETQKEKEIKEEKVEAEQERQEAVLVEASAPVSVPQIQDSGEVGDRPGNGGDGGGYYTITYYAPDVDLNYDENSRPGTATVTASTSSWAHPTSYVIMPDAEFQNMNQDSDVYGTYDNLPTVADTIYAKEGNTWTDFSIDVKWEKDTRPAGNYWVVVGAANEECGDAYSLYWIGPFSIYPEPQTYITAEGEQTTANKKYKVGVVDVGDPNLKVEGWYYIKKTGNGDYSNTNPSADEIKQNGTKINGNSTIVDLKHEELGGGYYTIYVLAENNFGATRIDAVKNLMLNNAPDISLKTINEKQEEVDFEISNKLDNKAVLNLKVNDSDVDSTKLGTLHGAYVVTTDKINVDENTSEIELKNKIMTAAHRPGSTSISGSGEKNYPIEINCDTGEITQYYIYAEAGDAEASTYFESPSILLDGTKLELQDMYVQENKDESYIVNQKLKISCEFNHEMMKQDIANMPDMLIKIGASNETIKQDSIEYDGSVVTYVFTIKDGYGEGTVKFAGFDYRSGAAIFKDSYSNTNTWNGEATEFKNKTIKTKDSKKEVKVDGNVATVTNVIINYVTDNKTTEYNTDNIKYLSNVKSVELQMEFSEPVVGYADIFMRKGRKYFEAVNINSESKRDATEVIEGHENATTAICKELYNSGTKLFNYEGELAPSMFINIADTLKDLGGNAVEDKGYNVIIQVNGVAVPEGQEIRVDQKVYTGEVVALNKILEYKNKLSPDTEVKVFAEYEGGNQKNYKNSTGLETIQLVVASSKAEGEQILPTVGAGEEAQNLVPAASLEYNNAIAQYTYLEGLGTSETAHYKVYNLTENQLPLKMVVEEGADFEIVTYKKDKLNNTTTNYVSIEAGGFMVDKTLSKLDVTQQQIDAQIQKQKDDAVSYGRDPEGETTPYFSLRDLQKDGADAIYKIYLKCDDEVTYTKENLKLKVGCDANPSFKPSIIEECTEETIDRDKYLVFNYKVKKGGKHNITLYDGENAIFEGLIDVRNVFIYGDVNEDGTISADDTITILRYIVHFISDEKIRYMGDVSGDGDGFADVSDAVALARFICEDPDVRIRR